MCYTDGSKKDFKTGFGAVLYKDYEEISSATGYLGINSTVFQAECNGIITGCKLVEECELEGDIHFKTDNQALVYSLSSHLVVSKTVEDTRHALNKLARKRKVTICWIRAHVGYVGNERADDLELQFLTYLT